MSMWMIFACLANSSTAPVTRSSKRAPIGDDQVRLVHRPVGDPAAVHAEHAEPVRVARGERAERHHVVVTGASVAAANARSSSAASAWTTPPPA
jgi:hypothetical protein